MADDDQDGQLINFPVSGDVRNNPPQLPDLGRLFPTPENDPEPDNHGGGITLPSFAIPMSPEMAVNSAMNSGGFGDGNSSPEFSGGDMPDQEGDADGGYVHRRSLADRLGDWIEYRINRGQGRHEAETAYRTAEGERKAALLKARTEAEVAAIQQNGKLRSAQTKASADLAAARGKSRADNAKTPSGGLGSGGKRGSGPVNSPAGSQKPKNPNSPARGNGANGGAKPEQRRNLNQPNKPGPRGVDKKPQAPNQPKNNKPVKDTPKPGGAGGSDKKPGAGGKDRTSKKDSSTDRPAKKDQKAKDANSGAKKQIGAGAGADSPKKVNLRKNKAKDTEAARGGAGTTPKHNRGVMDRADARKDGSKKPGPQKVDLTKKQQQKGTGGSGKGHANGGAQKASDGSAKGAGTPGLGGASKAAKGPSSASGEGGRKGAPNGEQRSHRGDFTDGARRPWEGREKGPKQPHDKQHTPGSDSGTAGPRWWNTRKQKPPTGPDSQTTGPVPADSVGITVERADRPHTDKPSAQDPKQKPAGPNSDRRGLPAAPEPHTKRPGTSRTTSSKETPVINTPTTNHTRGAAPKLAAEHQTDINLGEALTEIANIATTADAHKDQAEQIAHIVGKIADALRDMAADLVGDHNIDTQVTDLISNLADDAARMKMQAAQAAQECDDASLAALVAGGALAETYTRDQQAVDDTGLTYASAAAHH